MPTLVNDLGIDGERRVNVLDLDGRILALGPDRVTMLGSLLMIGPLCV